MGEFGRSFWSSSGIGRRPKFRGRTELTLKNKKVKLTRGGAFSQRAPVPASARPQRGGLRRADGRQRPGAEVRARSTGEVGGTGCGLMRVLHRGRIWTVFRFCAPHDVPVAHTDSVDFGPAVREPRQPPSGRAWSDMGGGKRSFYSF